MSNGNEVQQSQITTAQTGTRAPGYIDTPTQLAVQGATRQAQGTLPESYITSQSRDLAGQTVRGDFLDPSTNPYLQQTFDRGADAIKQRLDSQFSGSGRNLGAAQPVAKEDLSSFANQLFGGNYQTERDRQQSAMSQSSMFDPLNQFIQRIGPLADIAGRDTNVSSATYGNTEEKRSPLDTFLSIFG